ncbi:hypothetical protein NC653_024987 [Populus alba x Populus x berolinensis]|uniref:Uncharacterized protein n=1 Tax=Populus alba x Populus x berolinensis TaxID=444605 RepID=A0AAD6MAH4_9ROSI|nr:hypothetical protein NC653_024987 [Populus alba x Populus x berolinensis]
MGLNLLGIINVYHFVLYFVALFVTKDEHSTVFDDIGSRPHKNYGEKCSSFVFEIKMLLPRGCMIAQSMV